MTTPQDRLRHHVTGAIERGEAEPVVEQTRNQANGHTFGLGDFAEPCKDCGLPWSVTYDLDVRCKSLNQHERDELMEIWRTEFYAVGS